MTQNKNRATYDAIFTYLKGQRDLNPETITIDFERAALNSISEHFPTTAVLGCFFHFGQCLWRNLQSLGLQDWYMEPENSLLIKTIQALAFVPPDDVIEAFQHLMDSLDADTDERLSDFLAYFESNAPNTWQACQQVAQGAGKHRAYDTTACHGRHNAKKTSSAMLSTHECKRLLQDTHRMTF